MQPDLVIFDCDGVLVDSEPISFRVLIESINAAGVEIDTETAYRTFLGKSLATICAILRQDFGIDLGPSDLDAMRRRLYAAFRADLKPIPGIAAALDRLDLPHCVASSSQPERIRIALEATGLLERLEPNIFSTTMVAHGKPAPDLFLHAAEQMGVDPRGCTVIEDSPAGIEAARRAGMRAFAFAGGSHARSQQHRDALAEREPDLLFSDMTRLPELLRRPHGVSLGR